MGKVKERLQDEEDIYKIIGEEMFAPNPEFDKARKDATLQLLHILSRLVMENPTMRFGQILQNYGFVEYTTVGEQDIPYWINEFYLEPVALLKRVQAKLDDIKNPKG